MGPRAIGPLKSVTNYISGFSNSASAPGLGLGNGHAVTHDNHRFTLNHRNLRKLCLLARERNMLLKFVFDFFFYYEIVL